MAIISIQISIHGDTISEDKCVSYDQLFLVNCLLPKALHSLSRKCDATATSHSCFTQACLGQ